MECGGEGAALPDNAGNTHEAPANEQEPSWRILHHAPTRPVTAARPNSCFHGTRTSGLGAHLQLWAEPLGLFRTERIQ